ncbi:MAG: 30S ribosomal protein S17 [bacterium]|nr:30S ribosomal protein S17 [bacterium]MDT8395889.1 30S ribosomal protein S17 [bacterium]
MPEAISTERKIIVGKVVSNRMEKTAVVQVQRRFAHPVYKKFVSKRVKYKIHDEQNDLKVGDTVRIVETRPLSKDKRWRLLEILERAPQD